MRNIVNVSKLEEMLEDFFIRYKKSSNLCISSDKLRAYIFGNIRNYGLRRAKIKEDYWFWFRQKTYEEREIYEKSSGPFHLIDLQDFFFRVQAVLDFVCFSGYAQEKHLETLDFEVAEKKHDQWIRRLQRKEKALEGKTEIAYKFNNGYFVVLLLDKNAYEREGFLMNHCVGSYYGNSVSKIYSLRNSLNKPLVTMEVDNLVIIQYLMHSNKKVTEEYRSFLNEFSQAYGFKFKQVLISHPSSYLMANVVVFISFGLAFLGLRLYMSSTDTLEDYFPYVLFSVMGAWVLSGLFFLRFLSFWKEDSSEDVDSI